MRTLKLHRNESGQAAVEALFSVPLFLFLFLIGFQLFTITWNSQYVIVRSRYDIIKQANHKACDDSDNGHPLDTSPVTAEIEVPGDMKMLPRSTTENVKHTAYLVCN